MCIYSFSYRYTLSLTRLFPIDSSAPALPEMLDSDDPNKVDEVLEEVVGKVVAASAAAAALRRSLSFCCLLLSYEYNITPPSALPMPHRLRVDNVELSNNFPPIINIRIVLKCPSTKYVIGDVFSNTK